MTHSAETRLDGSTLIVRIPMRFQRRGGRKRIVAPDCSELVPATKPQPDGALLKALARAWRWQRMLDDGVYASISDIGDAENISKSYVTRILRLALLAPNIVVDPRRGEPCPEAGKAAGAAAAGELGRSSATNTLEPVLRLFRAPSGPEPSRAFLSGPWEQPVVDDVTFVVQRGSVRMPAQRSLRIAIAEDEFFLAEDLRQLVQAGGHEVVGVVATAPELVALVQHWRPDLALVDIQLARGSNGLDAAKVIKAQHGVLAIAVTANPDEEGVRKAGLLGLVPKPNASAVLPTVLRAAAEWLEKGRVEEHSSRFLFVGR